MKQMLICGADGFIGRNALEFFHGEYEITAVLFSDDDPKFGRLEGVKYICTDLRNEESVKNIFSKNKFDVVIQAAATTTGSKDVVERPYLHVTDNVVMNAWIFREAMLSKVGHVLFPSCTVMYQPSETALKETDFDGRDRIYDKFDLDKCHVVPAFVKKVSDAVSEFEVWGTGKAKRDVIYISDLINFIDLCIKNQKNAYELFNCGAGEAFPILQLARTVMKLQSKELQLIMDKTKPDIPTTVILDCEKAKKILGWEPKVGLEEGLRKTCDWYNQYVQ